MCLLCTKLYLRNKLVSKLIGKKLTVDVLDYFPIQLSYEVINSPFLLWKFYFDIISRIAFN